MTYFEKQEWESIEADIEALEERISEIEAAMQRMDLTLLACLNSSKNWMSRTRNCWKNTSAMNT